MNKITKTIIEKIKSQDLKMKPKSYFIFKTIITILIALFLILFILFLVSFIMFNLRVSGIMIMPKLGFFGLGRFFVSLPWILILSALILIVLLEVFSKRFTFIYRKPLVYSLLVIVLFIVLISFFIDKTSIHQNLFFRAQKGRLPVIGRFYKPDMRPKDMYFGKVVQLTENGFIIETQEEEKLNIIIDSKTRYGIEVKENDLIMVMGKKEGNTIKAIAVHKGKLPPLRLK